MKKIISGLLVTVCFAVTAEENSTETVDVDLPELGTPVKIISGAYYGLGAGISFMHHKISAKNLNTNEYKDFSKSGTQYDLALIAGFGSAFYKNYYAGLEFEIAQRFAGKSAMEGDIGVKFSSQFAINGDVRFGYLFPEQGNMVYASLGFNRALGKVAVRKTGEKDATISFGSYFPTVGLGFEHKINHKWNARIACKYSICSKDSGRDITGNHKWTYDAKPNKISLQLALTKNI
ncbi:MAG: hypothetical protein IJA14_04745 [Alphaproteobacteria bacterium]|nr:hypothetical protein [Alphaproteobacteria bacterium]